MTIAASRHDIFQWENQPFPRTLPQFQKLFPDDAACAKWLEGVKYPGGCSDAAIVKRTRR